jgi:RimJ/RimL family protein N-acetyltransferase
VAGDPAVAEFLAPGSADPGALRELIEAGAEGPDGLWVVIGDQGDPVGALQLSLLSRRSRICQISRLMVAAWARGAGVGSAAVLMACRQAFSRYGVHRVQAEVYGDNLAGWRLFERCGFTLEGVRRRAYWRREDWQDGVIYGLLAEEPVGSGPVGGSE